MPKPSAEVLKSFADAVRLGLSVPQLMAIRNIREDTVRRYVGWCRKDELLPQLTKIIEDSIVLGPPETVYPIHNFDIE